MSTRTISSTVLPGSPSLLVIAALTLARFAQEIDAWLQARSRAAEDRALLASMSDHELRDIGLDRDFASEAADLSCMRD